MSNPSSHDDSASLEPNAAVFARLTDVPIDIVDKLIETVWSVYGDLNAVGGHPYWGDLVLHQGAAMRALTEVRESLDAFRAEAVGARNTELGISVATAVIDGDRHYAHSDKDKVALVERILRPQEPARACHLFVWDRPYENDDIAGPYERLRVVTESDSELGVLNYTAESDEGELRSWHTFNPNPVPETPTLRFDSGSALTFPRDSLLPFADLRTALVEFARGGVRPESVRWQQARWGS